MKMVNTTISLEEIEEMSTKMFGSLVKAVVDIEQGIMVVDADLHVDQEIFLLENGSQQGNLWGINIYPTRDVSSWIEFDSMINLRPSWGNKTRGVDDPKIQEIIKNLVNTLVTR